MSFQVQNKTKRVFIGATLFLIASLIVFGTVLFLVSSRVKAVSLLEAETVLVSGQSDTARSVKRVLYETEEDRKILDSFFVKEEAIVDFLEVLEKAGRDAGVDLSISSVDASSKTQTLGLSVQTKGSFIAQEKFFSLIETLPFKLHVLRLDLSRDDLDEGGKAPLWKGLVTLTLESFISKQ